MNDSKHGLPFLKSSDRIAGVFLTHRHADTVVLCLSLVTKVPVFGSELTIEL